MSIIDRFECSPFYCWFSDKMDYLLQLPFDRNMMVQYSMIIAVFISITIPIALGTVLAYTKEYRDKEINKSFLREPTYCYQVYFVLPAIFLSILSLALGVQSGWIMYALLLFDLFSILVFIQFIRVVHQYTTNFEEYYSNKLKRQSNDIVEN